MDQHAYWTWEADIKPGRKDAFVELVRRWNDIAEKDPKTLYNNWTISEDETHVRVDQRFEDSAAAMAQYYIN